MPYPDDDNFEADLDDREDPDTDDADWNLHPATLSCPYCREEISEDAQQCPNCGNFISAGDAAPSRKPLWIIVGFILVVMAVLAFIF